MGGCVRVVSYAKVVYKKCDTQPMVQYTNGWYNTFIHLGWVGAFGWKATQRWYAQYGNAPQRINIEHKQGKQGGDEHHIQQPIPFPDLTEWNLRNCIRFSRIY